MISTYKRIFWFIKDQRKRYLIYLIAILISNILDVIPPKIIGMFTDRLSNGTLSKNFLWQSIIFLLIILIFRYVLGIVWNTSLYNASNYMGYRLRNKLIDKLLHSSSLLFEKFNSGDLMVRISEDINEVIDLAGFSIMCIADSFIYPIVVIAFMIYTTSWKLTLIALIPLIILFIIINSHNKIYSKKWTKLQEAFSSMNNFVVENVRGVRVVRSFSMEKTHMKTFNNLTKNLYNNNIETINSGALFQPVTIIFDFISYFISFIYGVYLLKSNSITIGALLSFFLYLSFLHWPIFAMAELIQGVGSSKSSLDRIYEVLNFDDKLNNNGNLNCEFIDDILFKDYYFKYPKNSDYILKNINLNIKNGKSLGIVGPTGSGKTTLVEQIFRLYPQDQEFFINGILVSEYKKAEVSKHFSFVSQENIIFSKTIRENIMYSNMDADENTLKEVLYISDLDKDIQKFKDGLNTLTGERGVALSGGQKQRISIARALLRDSDIILLDDALSAVDAKTENNILTRLRELKKDKTFIIVAHRFSAVKDLDEIIVLNNGEIVERGSHRELINNNAWYSEQYKIQQLEGEENDR